MTFQRSLYISIIFHILIFGSALAFAQFSRGALSGHWDAVIVSLVGSGTGSPGRAVPIKKRRDVRSDGQSVVSPGKTPPLVPSETLLKQSAQVEGSASMSRENKGKETDAAWDEAALQKQTGASAAGSGPGTQFGLISAEQWAVIESAIERSKNYPRMARERGIQGVVHVRFKLRPSGDVEAVEIVKSSGYDVLDSASIRTVYRAAPMPYVNGWVEVPMAYILK